jgi:hypothetical protein
MFFMYGIGLVIWLMLTDVGYEKSWKTFVISQRENFILFLIRCALATVITYLLLVLPGHYSGEVNWSGYIFVPPGALFLYAIYILLGRKRRGNWKEYLEPDRWNAIAMVGCFVMALCSTILRVKN